LETGDEDKFRDIDKNLEVLTSANISENSKFYETDLAEGVRKRKKNDYKWFNDLLRKSKKELHDWAKNKFFIFHPDKLSSNT